MHKHMHNLQLHAACDQLNAVPCIRIGKLCACVQSLGDSWLIVRLALNLFGYLGVGTRWSLKALRLILYAMLLMPGFIQVRFCNNRL